MQMTLKSANMQPKGGATLLPHPKKDKSAATACLTPKIAAHHYSLKICYEGVIQTSLDMAIVTLTIFLTC